MTKLAPIEVESRLDHITSALLHIIGAIEDEGDRAYFGSTNDADELRSIAHEMDAARWDAILAAKDQPHAD